MNNSLVGVCSIFISTHFFIEKLLAHVFICSLSLYQNRFYTTQFCIIIFDFSACGSYILKCIW
jgi:hypothetical protein